MFVVTASASQTGRHALRPSAIEATYMYQRKEPLSLFVPLFFRLSFSFLLPSFVPRATSFLLFTPCQPFSFPFFSLFAQPYTDNRWDNEYTIASSFLLSYSFSDITSFCRVHLFAMFSLPGGHAVIDISTFCRFLQRDAWNQEFLYIRATLSVIGRFAFYNVIRFLWYFLLIHIQFSCVCIINFRYIGINVNRR